MKKYVLAAVLSCGVGVASAYAADAEVTVEGAEQPVQRTEVGVLSCEVDGGIGLIIGSSKQAQCEFTRSDGSVERYSGSIGKLGLDIGITAKSFIKWVVVTSTDVEVGQHALAGEYVGVSAGGSLGLGLGANALIGGSSKNIGLQPFSAEGTAGLNVAVGVTKLTLQPAS